MKKKKSCCRTCTGGASFLAGAASDAEVSAEIICDDEDAGSGAGATGVLLMTADDVTGCGDAGGAIDEEEILLFVVVVSFDGDGFFSTATTLLSFLRSSSDAAFCRPCSSFLFFSA